MFSVVFDGERSAGEIFFGAAFTLELLLKILADGLSFLKDFWNWLDGLVLIVWYFERPLWRKKGFKML